MIGIPHAKEGPQQVQKTQNFELADLGACNRIIICLGEAEVEVQQPFCKHAIGEREGENETKFPRWSLASRYEKHLLQTEFWSSIRTTPLILHFTVEW